LLYASSAFELEEFMIGKIVRMLVGRSIARKRGFSGAAGAAAGLLAPIVIRRSVALARRGGSAALESRRRRREPNYLKRIS
jgi:hypothetical protein